MPALASMSQADLDALAEEQAAQDAAAAPVAPPYDPAQDTQGMQAQPNTIAPTTPAAAENSTNASYAYRTGQPTYDTGTAPPESTQQTIDAGAPVAPPPSSPDKYGQGIAQQYGQMQEASRTAPQQPVTGATSFGAPDSMARGTDLQTRYPGKPGQPTEMDRLRQKVGRVGSWFDTPTAAGSLGQPPPDRPDRGINPVQAALGVARFLKNFGPGGPGNLVGDVINDVLPYQYSDPQVLRDTLVAGGATPMPEWLQHLVPLARHALFRDPSTGVLTKNDQDVIDRTDAYVGIDREYLGRMANLPWYLRPLRPGIARGYHALAAAPYPGWFPFPPGATLPAWMLPQPDREVPDWAGQEHIEPGVYYDDPYIPGPDHPRPRRTS